MIRRYYREQGAFTFHGEGVDDGTIAMGDYGRAIIGYSVMVGEAVRVLDPHADIPDVRVVYQDRGSFTTGVSVGVRLTLPQVAFSWLAGDVGLAVERAVNITGGALTAVSIVVAGAVGLGKYLRGRRIVEREEVSPTHEDLTLDDGEVVNRPTQVINLTVNNNFRNGVRDFIQPTFTQGVDNVNIIAGGRDLVSLDRGDRQWFARLDKDTDQTWTEEMRLRLLSVSFDGKRWRFEAIPDTGPTYTFAAPMLDDEFADRIALNAVRFEDGDEIDAIVQVTIFRERRVRRAYEVLKVNGIHHRPRMDPLFD